MSIGEIKRICRICLRELEPEQEHCPKCSVLYYTCSEHPNLLWTGKEVCPECGRDPKKLFVDNVEEDREFWDEVVNEVLEAKERLPEPEPQPEPESQEKTGISGWFKKYILFGWLRGNDKETGAASELEPPAEPGPQTDSESQPEPKPPQEPKSEPDPGSVGAGELVLVGPDGRPSRIRIETVVGKSAVSQFGEDARFWHGQQFKLKPLDEGWAVFHNPRAINETLLNGRAFIGGKLLKDGDQLAVGRESMGIIKLPFKVKIS